MRVNKLASKETNSSHRLARKLLTCRVPSSLEQVAVYLETFKENGVTTPRSEERGVTTSGSGG